MWSSGMISSKVTKKNLCKKRQLFGNLAKEAFNGFFFVIILDINTHC